MASLPALGLGVRSLALRSRFALSPSPLSQRTAAVDALRAKLASVAADQYVVVTGPKGVGKSCVVDTATRRTCGVVHVGVAAGTSQKDIVRDTLLSVANVQLGFVDPRPSVLRVLRWYALVLPPPIVVLRAHERAEGEAYARITGAVRDLVSCGLRVLVDASTNSLQPEALATLRQRVLELEPMPRDLLLTIPEHAHLFAMLRAERLEGVVWAVLGGVPAHYNALRGALLEAPSDDAPSVVAGYVRAELRGAIDRRNTLLAAHPAMGPILDEFRSRGSVPKARLVALGAESPSPNKVLRAVATGDAGALNFVPADAAMALVLRHRLSTAPSVTELSRLCALPPLSEGEGV